MITKFVKFIELELSVITRNRKDQSLLVSRHLSVFVLKLSNPEDGMPFHTPSLSGRLRKYYFSTFGKLGCISLEEMNGVGLLENLEKQIGVFTSFANFLTTGEATLIKGFPKACEVIPEDYHILFNHVVKDGPTILLWNDARTVFQKRHSELEINSNGERIAAGSPKFCFRQLVKEDELEINRREHLARFLDYEIEFEQSGVGTSSVLPLLVRDGPMCPLSIGVMD
ncbi:hypothetical protein Tco_1210310 [Tanacetum coccineum]